MRIISGTFKGRTLIAPPEGTRPTADRAKEMLFDMLSSRLLQMGQRWTDLRFADIFAGSGAIGLEAASRGAKNIFLFENNPVAQKIIHRNGKGMFFELYQDALCPPPVQKPMNILFMDPPYGQRLWEKALPEFSKQNWIGKETLIIIEEDKTNRVVLPEGFILEDKRSAGRNTFYFVKGEN